MEDSKKKRKKVSILLNIIIPLIFFLCVIVIEKTNIVLYFSKPVCHKSNDYTGFINGKVMPIYLFIVLIINIIINKNENKKFKLFFKQFGIGIIVYLFFVGLVIFIFSPFNRFVFTFKSPDNNTTYIIEEKSELEISSITLKKGSYISSKELSHVEMIEFPYASLEISWIDNQTFNLKIIPPSWNSQKDKTAEYYTFKSLEKLEPIEYIDYASKQYIKTEELIIK